MLKTLTPVVLVMVALSALPSCRKCYTCVNVCNVCTLRDSATGAVLEQQILYSDSSYYQTYRGVLIDSGYSCVKGPSTYSVSFCVNSKKAEDQYLPYYQGNGRYVCSPK